VYIDKLVCKGFKSFGREVVTIKLNKGFTCIVGPNGSGKSNVVDAILFVLGQLSAKTLRANVFSDLLYSPPKPNMPPKAKSASVELYFDNRDRGLHIEADKVVISRELDDSGKSVCRINGKTVTRSTVLDVLGPIGVDPNGYNLVLQGEIAQIVTVSPIDRRKLLEEIAGISAYDEQKDRALKKLAESESNLGKVDMQLQERRRHLEKLSEDREGALRYSRIRDQIQKVRIDNIAWTMIKSQRRIETITETLVQRAEEAEKIVSQLNEVEKNIAAKEVEIEEIEGEIDQITGGESAKISEQYGIVSAALNHVRAELERAKAGYEKAVRERDALELELSKIQEELSGSEATVKEKTEELAELEAEIAKNIEDIKSLEERHEKVQADYLETTVRLQDLSNQMISLDEGVSEVRSAIKSDSRELGLAYEELRDAEESLSRTETELTELRTTVPAKREELQNLENSEKAKATELEKVKEQLGIVNAEVDESTKIVRSTREELIKAKARQEALKEAEEAFLKRRRALARVLELRDLGKIEGIHGTVAELGTIDPDYAVAMEVAGGSRLSYVVVENDEIASQCIDVLKNEHVGRVSFIPLNRIKTSSPGNLPKEDGIIGFAIDLVKFEPKMRPAFQFVFSDTLVTEDFKTAKRLGFKGRRAVSLDGDLVERSGLITGGYFQKTAGGLSLQVEDTSPEIEEKLKGLETILSELKTKQEDLRKQNTDLERDLSELSKRIYRDRIELEGLEEDLGEAEARSKILIEKITNTKKIIYELETNVAGLRERDEELSAHRETVRALRDESNEALAKSDAAKINQEIKDLNEILEFQKTKRETLQGERTKLQVAVDERLSPKATELEDNIQDLNDTIPGLEEEVRRVELELVEKESEFQKLRSRRDEIEDAIKDKRVRQIELKENLRNLRLELEDARAEQVGNEKAVYRLQTEQNRLETDLVGLKAELASMTQIEKEVEKRENLPELTLKEIEGLEEKIRELERELEAMGPVNLKALTDYEAEKDRYEEIVDKKTKLEEEHKEILRFMEEIEAEKTRKFLRVYNEIADNFAKMFSKLSPGGEATLMLENIEHPLMGGITVRSKPRGKELVTLDAMSGGEKTLTGLALIFAIQMHSPSSFYIFDEIDANLDDVNAHNVALLISEMSKSSQFIVVSLRDTTVRKADLLVGVSNQDGISRIVSVDLEEVAAST
jgi:chromosome segregation protein